MPGKFRDVADRLPGNGPAPVMAVDDELVAVPIYAVSDLRRIFEVVVLAEVVVRVLHVHRVAPRPGQHGGDEPDDRETGQDQPGRGEPGRGGDPAGDRVGQQP